MPPGSDVVVMATAAFTVIVSDLVALTPSASVRVTVKVWLVAVAPTVPVIAPVEAFSVSPLGRDPVVTDQAYGVVPPVPASVWL